MLRNGRINNPGGKPMPPAHEQKMRQLRAEGRTVEDIAWATGYHYTTVVRHTKGLGS